MNRECLLVAGLIALVPDWSPAQSTVNFSAGPGQRDVINISHSPLANGNMVKVGFFDPGFDVSSLSGNMAALSDAWNEFGSTSVTTIFGEPGRFSGTGSTTNTMFDVQKIWMWAFQTSDNAAPASGFGNVVGYGLFSSTDSKWSFPAQGTLPPGNTTSVNSSDVNQAFHGAFDSTHLTLNPIPEPSTGVLVIAGLASLAWLGRKRHVGQTH